MSRSHGTGQPNWPRCAKCRLGNHHQSEWAKKRGQMNRLVLSGQRRYRPNYNGGRVDVFYQYEYRCLDCGHVGWSRHIDIAKRWVREHQQPAPDFGPTDEVNRYGRKP